MWQRWNQSSHIFEKSTDNGGSWTPLGLNASIITEGTIADTRLPSNLARMDQPNNTNFIISGSFFESSRSQPLGYWQDIPFNAANFVAQAPMAWNVGAGAVVRNRYTLIGKTVIWSLYISWFSGSNSLSGSPTPYIGINGLPLNPLGAQLKAIDFIGGIAGAPSVNGLIAEATSGGIQIRKDPGTNFALTDVPGFITTIILELG